MPEMPRIVANTDGSRRAVLAGWWRRVLAIAIDCAIWYLTALVIAVFVAVVSPMRAGMSPYQLLVIKTFVFLFAFGLPAFVWWIFPVACGRQTVGQLVFDVCVLREDGFAALGFVKTIIRLFIMPLSFAIAFLGFITGFLDSKNRTWHDRIVHAVVLRRSSIETILPKCADCGYDLRGSLSSDKCPECGKAIKV